MDPTASDLGLLLLVVSSAASAVVRMIRLSRSEPRECRLDCPKTGERVHCVVLQATDSERCLGIERCSGMNPHCTAACVRLMNAGFDLDRADTAPETTATGKDDQRSREARS